MASFDFVVDTQPMADSVAEVAGHVNGTTAAVAAMQAAVIASEIKSADKICKNVDKGFYNLVRSQISMKLSVCYTEMQAKLSLLMEYSKALSKTQERMNTDFNRVKGQYLGIFKGLDKALFNRISQLDRDAVRTADVRKKVVLGQFERQIPEAVVTSLEVENSDAEIKTARLKSKTNNSLDYLSGKVRENNSYKSLMDAMLEHKSIESRSEQYVPVVYAYKQSTLVEDSYVFSLHYPEYLSEQTKNSINLNILSQDELCANDEKDELEKRSVSDEFQSMVASAGLDRRIGECMMKLFRQGGC